MGNEDAFVCSSEMHGDVHVLDELIVVIACGGTGYRWGAVKLFKRNFIGTAYTFRVTPIHQNALTLVLLCFCVCCLCLSLFIIGVTTVTRPIVDNGKVG